MREYSSVRIAGTQSASQVGCSPRSSILRLIKGNYDRYLTSIRLKLLKLGAKVINSVRRIKLSLPDACPYKDLFFKAHAALAPP